MKLNKVWLLIGGYVMIVVGVFPHMEASTAVGFGLIFFAAAIEEE